MARTLGFVIAGLLPGLFWLWYVRRKDAERPEPRRLVLRVFFLGCGAAAAVYALRPRVDAFLPSAPGPFRDALDAFVATALLEEVAKLLAFAIGALWHRELDEPLDGVVYGAAAGLGFASLENVAYLFFTEEVSIVAMRAFTATLGHLAFTGSMGFLMGLARFTRGWKRLLCLFLGPLVAVLLHGSYDLCLMSEARAAQVGLLLILPAALVLLGIKIRWSRKAVKGA